MISGTYAFPRGAWERVITVYRRLACLSHLVVPASINLLAQLELTMKSIINHLLCARLAVILSGCAATHTALSKKAISSNATDDGLKEVARLANHLWVDLILK